MDFDGVLLGKVIGGLMAGAGMFWVWGRRILSQAKVANAKDAAEVSIISRLEAHLEGALARAEKAESERNEAIRMVGKLEGQVTALQTTLTAMQNDLAAARDEIKSLRELLKK